jgi:biotin transport system substrate-specific component
MIFQNVENTQRNTQLIWKGLVGSAMIAIGAQMTIPFGVIPFTLQTTAVLLVASLLGPRHGVTAVMFYLLEGVAGAPVFAGFSSGVHVILGPSGGYLIGFVPTVYFVGKLLQRLKAKDYLKLFLIGLVGAVITHIFGYLNLLRFLPPSEAFAVGVLPFYYTEIVKLLVFTLLVFKKTE